MTILLLLKATKELRFSLIKKTVFRELSQYCHISLAGILKR